MDKESGLQMDISFEEYAYNDMFASNYYVIDDADYQMITEGPPPEWMEYLTVFNVTDVEASCSFARNLCEEIIRCSELWPSTTSIRHLQSF